MFLSKFKSAAYTEEMTNEKLGMVKAKPDVSKLEDRLEGGQIEEVILQAENALSPVRTKVQWKPWEPLVQACQTHGLRAACGPQ